MKKFLLKFLTLFTGFIILLYIVDLIIQEGLKTSNYRDVTKWSEVVNGGINAEIIIVGSSRAQGHFDCEKIEKKKSMTCFNLGFEGTNYPRQKKMLELYLERNTIPKQIIWSLDYHSFKLTEDFFGFENLIPFQNEPIVRELLEMNSISKYLYGFPIIRYSFNSKMKKIGILSFFGAYKGKARIKKGYLAQKIIWDNKFDEFKLRIPNGFLEDFNQSVFNEFSNYSSNLKKKGVEVQWIISPYFLETKNFILNSEDIQKMFKERSNLLRISFFDFSNSEISKEKRYFYNGQHLNYIGVQKFMDLYLND